MRYYCTYFDRNYLTRGIALIRSLNRHETQEFTLFVVCLDDLSLSIIEKLNLPHVACIPLQAIEHNDSALLAAKTTRTLVEYYWTLTSTIILRVLEWNNNIEALSYLDADLFFFSSPDPIFQELGTHSILIHEHRFSPSLAHLERESGKYNVGWMSFRNDASAKEALTWWRERCIEWCYGKDEDGKMGDQMYLDDWPTRFPRTVVLQHIGAAVAPWNHEQYQFTRSDSGEVQVNHAPLIFYHFHSLEIASPELVIATKHLAYQHSKEILQLCFLPYVHALSESMGMVRSLLPDFSYGLNEKAVLTDKHTFLASKTITPNLGHILKTPIDLDNEWIAYCAPRSATIRKTSLWNRWKVWIRKLLPID